MYKLCVEKSSVWRLEGGLLLIHFDQIFDNGLSMGGDFVCDLANVPTLIELMEIALRDQTWNGEDRTVAPDNITVFTRSDDKTWIPNFHMQNQRDPSAPYGRGYGFSGISQEVFETMLEQIRTASN